MITKDLRKWASSKVWIPILCRSPDLSLIHILEVKSLDELESMGKEKIRGKIVFYNRPMDPTQIRTFNSYGGAADQRVYGPSKAAEYGAVAAIVRSLTTANDDFPHTGVTVYKDSTQRVPGISISTNDANMLSKKMCIRDSPY